MDQRKNIKLSQLDKNTVLELDYYDVVDKILDAANNYKESSEAGINFLLEAEPEDLANFIALEYEPVFIYNSLNTEFGLGLLVGMISSDFDIYRMTSNDEEGSGDLMAKYNDEDLN